MLLFAIGGVTSAGERDTKKICGAQTPSDNAGHLGTGGSSCSGCRWVRGRALVKLLHSLAYETVRQFYLVVVGGAFEEGSEFARARRVAQLAQSFGFDLTNTFASDSEGLADFFESVFAAIV